MKIDIKLDWDELPSGYHNPSPYFSGRKKELNLLKHIILNKSSGSVLIAAFRGTGKTDLTYKAVSEAKKANQKLIPIIFNATHLVDSLELTEKEISDEILKNLIRRTYTALKDIENKELSKEISLLYLQATSKKYQEQIKLIDSSEEDSAKIDQEELMNKWFISVKKKDLLEAIRKAFPISTLSVLYILSLLQINSLLLFFIFLFLIITGFLSQVIDFNISKNKSEESTEITKTNKNIQKMAKTMFLKDNSFGNLENGLKNFLQNASEKGYKLVFVVDELDKLDESGSKSLGVIRKFKGIFNHADTLFLFIVDENVYRQVEEARVIRNTSSTLFSQRIYLNRSTSKDMRDYLSAITKFPKGESNFYFENFVLYKARMDYYRMPDVLRDYINYGESKLYIDWNEESNELKQIANKQNIISLLLEEGGYLYSEESNKYKNETLINEVYSFAEHNKPSETREFPEPDISDMLPEDKLIFQIKNDMAKYFYMSGIYKKEAVSRAGETYTSYIPTNNPGTQIHALNEFLEFEDEFLHYMQMYSKDLLRAYNLWAKYFNIEQESNISEKVVTKVSTLIDIEVPDFRKYFNLSMQYKQNPSSHPHGQEEVSKFVTNVKKSIADFNSSYILTILKNIIAEVGSFPTFILTNNPSLLDSYPLLKDMIVKNNTPHLITYNSSSGKVSIVLMTDSESLIANKELIKEVKNSYKLKVLELRTREIEVIQRPKNLRSKKRELSMLQVGDIRYLLDLL